MHAHTHTHTRIPTASHKKPKIENFQQGFVHEQVLFFKEINIVAVPSDNTNRLAIRRSPTRTNSKSDFTLSWKIKNAGYKSRKQVKIDYKVTKSVCKTLPMHQAPKAALLGQTAGLHN